MIRDLAALVGGQLASRLLGFVAFAYLARQLVPEAYGAVEFAAALATVGGIFIDAGVGTIGVRRMARGEQAVERIAGEVLATRLTVAAAVATALGGAAWLLVPDPTAQRLLALYAASLLGIPWAQAWLFQGAHRIGYSALVQTVRMGTFALAVVVLVRGAGDVLAVGAAEIAAVGVAALCAATLQVRKVTPLRFHFEGRALLALMRESLPVGLSNVIWAVNQYLPPLLVASLAGLHASAFFSAAHRLCISVASFAWIYHFNLLPSLFRKAAAGRAALEELVGDSFRVSAWAAIGMATVLSLAAAPLLGLMFGAGFTAAANAFELLIWTLPILLLGDHARWTLVATGSERAVTAAQALGMTMTIAGGGLLIPAVGALGGAMAILLAGLVVWVLLHALARRRLGWMPLLPAAKPALLAALLLAAARLVALPELVESAAAALLFAGIGLAIDRQIPAALRGLARARSQLRAELLPEP